MFFKKDFFSAAEKQLITDAIRKAEAETSGEIRVFIEPKCKGDVIEYATHILHKFDLHKKTHRNAVIFYLAYKDKKFAVIGDEGIHKMVGDNFWEDVKKTMEELFKQNQFVPGLQKGIGMAGEKLKQFFPHQAGDKNERADDLTIRK